MVLAASVNTADDCKQFFLFALLCTVLMFYWTPIWLELIPCFGESFTCSTLPLILHYSHYWLPFWNEIYALRNKTAFATIDERRSRTTYSNDFAEDDGKRRLDSTIDDSCNTAKQNPKPLRAVHLHQAGKRSRRQLLFLLQRGFHKEKDGDDNVKKNALHHLILIKCQ